MLTQERLKQLLQYDPNNGRFTRLVARGPSKAGSEAGRKNTQGYRHIHIDGHDYLSHRLAFLYMTGSFPGDEVDHINRVRNDNRWANLRHATRLTNNTNKGVYRNNASGVPGVSWKAKYKRWNVMFWADGKEFYVGSFQDKQSAIKARAEALAAYQMSRGQDSHE